MALNTDNACLWLLKPQDWLCLKVW